jgi:acetyl-CoA carboxylase biotin carboxyl carrier protein
VPLDFNEIRQLLITITQTDIAEVSLKSEDFELTVRKTLPGQGGLVNVGGSVTIPPQPPITPVVTPPTETPTSRSTENNTVAGGTALPVTPPPTADQKLVEVSSPMVGTFYRSPAPNEAPFVDVGDRVRRGQTVCIIEAMKLMNEIETEVSGQVIEILVQNGEAVEYGQPLMRIKPD